MANWVNSKFKPKREEKQNQELLFFESRCPRNTRWVVKYRTATWPEK